MMEPARFRPLHAPPRVSILIPPPFSRSLALWSMLPPNPHPSTGTWTWGEATLHMKNTISSLKEDP